DNSEVPIEAKHPIYLPRESPITRLYIIYRHCGINHFDQQHTLTELRQRVWIPKGVTTVKSALRHCMQCKRARPRHYRTGDGNQSKCWLIILTCLHIRATFLDVITDVSLKTLLSRIRRFVASYGSPSTILCDNASSFVALNRLQEAFRANQTNETVDYCAKRGIQFKFLTPLSPWSGGAYERIVGLTKTSLKAVLGTKILLLEEVTTLVKETEAILNTRPLTAIGSDLDFTPLCPVDFLSPYATLSLPRLQAEGDGDNDDEDWRPRPTLRDSVIDSWTSSMSLLPQRKVSERTRARPIDQQ
ncbi:hypothetical protein PMAYCL1PPCAC_33318, partial [Pristionchus mayeri]